MATDDGTLSGGTVGSGIRRLEFAKDITFQTALRQRVEEWFESSGRRKRDCWQMYFKSALILGLFGVSWWLLVFVAQTLVEGLLLSVVLAMSTALIGFNIQHDGGHGAYSDNRWINRIAAGMLGLIGGSSYTWRWKHVVIHHMYVNITGYDGDVSIGPLGRFTPHQKRLWFHRWQRFYLWAFYGFDAMKLQLLDDFRFIVTGRMDQHRIGRPLRWELVNFIMGKVAFVSLAFVVPMLLHSVWVVLFYYVVTAWMVGMAMVLVFITPHLVPNAEFPLPRAGTGQLDRPWAAHQAMVTVDFARGNRILTWLLGGLNFHKEHHLFPMICHVNYPQMAKVVERTCHEFGLPYEEHRSMLSGIASHYRWLKRLGTQD